jgi:microcystin-dependent protein
MADPFLAEIKMFGSNFAPVGWAFCNGQLLAIAQNTALFSLLGTTYGGNGTTTFALPDFRSRAPVHMGQGVGLSNYVLGEETGTETVSLNITQIPQHNHLLSVSNATASVSDPTNAFPAQVNGGTPRAPVVVNAYAAASSGATFAATAISTAGGSTPHSNIQPVLAVSFIIALQGIFPSRN